MLNICRIKEWLSGNVGNRDLVYMWEKQKKNAGQQELYIRSRLMKGSEQKKIKERKRHLLPEQKDRAQWLEAFSGNRRRSCSQPSPCTLCDLRQRTQLYTFFLLTGVDIFTPLKGTKDSSNTVERMNTSPWAGHYQHICVQNIDVKYFCFSWELVPAGKLYSSRQIYRAPTV